MPISAATADSSIAPPLFFVVILGLARALLLIELACHVVKDQVAPLVRAGKQRQNVPAKASVRTAEFRKS